MHRFAIRSRKKSGSKPVFRGKEMLQKCIGILMFRVLEWQVPMDVAFALAYDHLFTLPKGTPPGGVVYYTTPAVRFGEW